MRVALIPARGGSKRIPRKNVREFAGRPIIAWPIQAALDSGLFDRVICSTDDDQIAAVAERWGAEAPFRRPAALADDFTPTAAVIGHALDWMEQQGLDVEAFCCIYATAPFVTAELLRTAYERMRDTGASYCLPVVRFPAPIQRAVRTTADGRLEMFTPAHFGSRSQDLEPAYFDAGQFVWGRPHAIRAGVPAFGPQTAALEVPAWSAVDIDSAEDWERAEQLWTLRDRGAGAGGFNVLITSVSQKLSCVREVRGALHRLPQGGSVHGADLDPDCLAKGFVDAFWAMPRVDSLPLDVLLDYCRHHGIRAIVPTRDGELPYFAEHREALGAEGVTVMVSDPEVVALCLDKLRFARELLQLGYPAIPATATATECDGGALVVKERFGAGARGIRLNVAREAADAVAREFDEPIFQPLREGVEYSVDTFSTADGRTKGAIARRRDRVRNGESQITTAVDAPDLERLCAEMAARIGLRGHAVWQVIRDAGGGLHVIECNCRIGGASSLSIAMGLDSFYWGFCEATGENLDEHPFRRAPVNLRQTRVPCDVIATDPGL